MRYPDSFLDDIRDRASLVEVVKRRVALKSKGRGEYSGLCPFHKEKTPSFTVSNDKQFYHCFGCSAHGDAFKFLMETDGISFADAVERMAGEVGLPMPDVTPQMQVREKHRLSLYEVMEQACLWFQSQLSNEDGHEAMRYVNARGIKPETQKLFRLGYAPANRNALKVALLGMDVSESTMLELGLVIKNDRGEVYDRFRQRLIFPICNAKGQVIAFGGRILGEGQPKYLNSPETPLFHKGDVLYNEHLVRHKAFKSNRLVVAEGYMDVLAMHQAGITVAVAPLGTALTENQLQRLWRMVKEPVICLDGDSAGQRAMERAAQLTLCVITPGCGLRFAALPHKQDPDDVIRTQGVPYLREILKNSKPLSETVWNMQLSHTPPVSPEAIASLEKAVNDLVKTIKDEHVRPIFQQFFKQKIWDVSRQRKAKTQNKAPSKMFNQGKAFNVEPLRYSDLSVMPTMDINTEEGISALLLLLVVRTPALLAEDDVSDMLMALSFSPTNDSLLDNMHRIILDIVSLDEISPEMQSFSDFSTQSAAQQSYEEVLAHYSKVLDGFPTDRMTIKKMWNYFALLFQRVHLKKECDKVAGEFSLEAEEKFRLLRNEYDTIDQTIRHMESSFGETELV